ncbi:MAG: MaoC/PaaZ C-terminal domain-containing protein [Nitrososphaerota archaeon]
MFFEDFTEGQKFTTRSRIVTSTDIEVFTSLTWAANPLFLSDAEARKKGLPSRVVPGALTLSIAIGLLYQLGLFDHITALAGLDKLSFKSPTHAGDEVAVRAEVLERRETKNIDRGLVRLSVKCENRSRNTVAFESEMVFVILKRQTLP